MIPKIKWHYYTVRELLNPYHHDTLQGPSGFTVKSNLYPHIWLLKTPITAPLPLPFWYPLPPRCTEPQMPDNTGKSVQVYNPGVTCHTHVVGTPGPSSSNTTIKCNLAAKLVATSGPIKSTTDAKVYLEQRSLIAVNNNFDLNSLAHLLISTYLNSEIPD